MTGFFDLLGNFYLPKLSKNRSVPNKSFPSKSVALDRPKLMPCDFNGKFIFDIEVYPNFFLISFLKLDTGRVCYFHSDMNDWHTHLDRLIASECLLIGFNSNHYDIPILLYASGVKNTKQIYKKSKSIITGECNPYRLKLKYKNFKFDHIDILNMFKGFCGLKYYAARLFAKTIIELPFDPDQDLSGTDKNMIVKYCVNDLMLTKLLYDSVIDKLELRIRMSQKYKIDLRSAGNAQIAEQVIKKLYNRDVIKKEYVGEIKFYPPDVIKFESKMLNDVFQFIKDTVFGENGKFFTKKNQSIIIDDLEYNIGIGGIHTKEKNLRLKSTPDEFIFDFDVVSFYPSIILRFDIYPPQIGYEFIKILAKLVDSRLSAKRNNLPEAEDLKIVINSAFGMFNYEHSILFCPKNMLRVTLTGQLLLLMLIESVVANGITVKSANTDGILVSCHKSKLVELEKIIKNWQDVTGMTLEKNEYDIYFSNNVNNYFAIMKNGKIKRKGLFVNSGLDKNPFGDIVADAIIKFFQSGAPIEKTIRNCEDFRKFVFVTKIKNDVAVKCHDDPRYGSAQQSCKMDFSLGSICRWYYAKHERGAIYRKSNGNLISRTDEGACPIFNFENKIPDDLNYDWYIREAKSILGCDYGRD